MGVHPLYVLRTTVYQRRGGQAAGGQRAHSPSGSNGRKGAFVMIRPYRRYRTQKGNPAPHRVSPGPTAGTPTPWRAKMKTLNTIAGRATGGFLILTLFLSACSRGDDKKAAPARPNGSVAVTESTSTATPTSPNTELAAAVEAAYREATAAEFAFDSEVGPFQPASFKERVGRYLTGAQYEASFQLSQQRRLRGEIFSPPGLQPGEIAPVVAVEGPTKATIRDCAADHATVKASTGERVDEPIDGRELVIVEMVLEDGQWKIANTQTKGERCTV